MKRTNTLIALLVMALAGLTACTGDEPQPSDTNINTEATTIQFRLGVLAGAQSMSRADGKPDTETATAKESALHDATIIIYGKSLRGALTDNDKVLAHMSFDLSGGVASTATETIGNVAHAIQKEYTTDQAPFALGPGTYYAIAITNIQDKYSSGSPSLFNNNRTLSDLTAMKLSDLRELVYTRDLCDNSQERFVMTSVREVEFTCTADDHALSIGLIPVQRLAARVDVAFDTNNTGIKATDDGIALPIYDKATDGVIANAEFIITGLALSDCINTGTYVVERNNDDGDSKYFGADGNWWGGVPGRMVTAYPGTLTSATLLTSVSAIKTAKPTDNTFTTLAYISETGNTNNGVPRAKLTLTGLSNLEGGHFGAPARASYVGKYTAHTATIGITHSLPGAGFTIHGTVRNTIYRVKVKIVADGDALQVIWYWYNGNSVDGLTDNPYTVTTPFSPYIIESDGTQPND